MTKWIRGCAGLRYGIPFQVILEILESAEGAFLRLVEPDAEDWLLAERIASGHPSFGRPGLADSLYHSIAIRRGGNMITADRAHFNKTRHLRHIALLQGWGAEL